MTIAVFDVEDAWKAIEHCPLFNSFIIRQVKEKARQRIGSVFYEEISLDKHGAVKYSTNADGIAFIKVLLDEACLAWLQLGEAILEMEGLDSFSLMAEAEALGITQKTLEDFC